MHPTTDIVCLVHNGLSITSSFVDHLFKNTENFNLIFIDNGSTDKVQDFLQEGASQDLWVTIRSEENLGIITGRNLGAQHINSDYFLNIDNDQHVGYGWLQKLHTLMEKDYDIVGSEAWCLTPPSSRGSVVLAGRVHSRDYYPFKHCKRKGDKFTYVGCGGMLIKKAVYDDIGLFDEIFSPAYFEDPDFSFRSIQAGYKLGWLHNCPINHLSHQTISSQNLFHKNPQFVKSWKSFQKKWRPYFPNPLQMRD